MKASRSHDSEILTDSVEFLGEFPPGLGLQLGTFETIEGYHLLHFPSFVYRKYRAHRTVVVGVGGGLRKGDWITSAGCSPELKLGVNISSLNIARE